MNFIFNRTNKGIIITKEGEVFLSYARQILELKIQKRNSDKLIAKYKNLSLDDKTTAFYSEKDKDIFKKGDTGQDNRLTKENKKIRNKNKKINKKLLEFYLANICIFVLKYII